MIVFDSKDRTDNSYKKNGETNFDFYNRSSRDEITRARELLEDYVSRYPPQEVDELISRIRSGDDVAFKSATFEIFIYEALCKIGFELTIHPELPNGNPNCPDFLVKDKEGNEFYLEATLSNENRQLDEGAEARKGAVYDYLNKNSHENFYVIIDDEGCPNTQPSGKKITKVVHDWLDSLDPDMIDAKIKMNGIDSIESFEWTHENWIVRFKPIPIGLDKRGQSEILIGVCGSGAGWLDNWSPIKNKIKFKGNKYKILDKPLLIAVNHSAFHLKQEDEMQALFGQEQIMFDRNNPHNTRLVRKNNGAWNGIAGPQYTRVSGAWIFNDLHLTSLAGRNQTIYLNPWAINPLPDSLHFFPYAFLEGEGMQWNSGTSFAELFELNSSWPEL